MTPQFDASDLDLSIDQSQLKPLFKIESYKHGWAMVFNWVMIILSILLCIRFFHPVLYFFAVIVIGARMHALAILMHDATHFRFLKNRYWNDLLTNIFVMYPLFSSIEQYRQNHLRHHRHLNTEEDPDWVAKLGKREFRFPKTRMEFFLTVVSYLVLYQGMLDAVWFLKRFSGNAKQSAEGKVDKKPRIIFMAVLFALLTIFGCWKYYLQFWVIPYLSTFFMFQYIRSVAEHFGELAYDHLLTSTRTVKTNWLERFFIAPHHVGYHLEHHLYPGVPYYNLPKLHQVLMTDKSFADKAHLTQGYISGLMNELGKVEH